MGKWAAAFSKLDAKALASLYSKNAFFFGSNPNLYRGNDGVTAYFSGLPRWSSPSVQFTEVRTAQATADLINVAGTASFVVAADAEPLVVKISWVIVREDGEWKIVNHHVSSKTPLIEPRMCCGALDRNASLATPADAPHGFGELGIFLRHRLVGFLLRSLLGLAGLLPGHPLGLLALIARLALRPRLDETALFSRRGSGR